MEIDVRPATSATFDDLATVLAPQDPTSPACWCLSYRMSSGDLGMQDGPGRRGLMKKLCGGATPPGVLAYRDDEVVGWCSVNPRSSYHRLMHSRVIPTVDDEPVWSVVCFVVRPGFRRQGIADELLKGAVAFAQERGATALEGYPADNNGTPMSSSFAYTGTRALFERAGFSKVSDTTSRTGGIPRVIMRLTAE